MKINPHPLIPAGFAAVLLAPAIVIAIEPPADDAPPPAAIRDRQVEAPPVEPRVAGPPPAPIVEARPEAESSAFVGVVTAPVPEMLAAHLDLEAGRGVIVRAVLPDGPAAAAGVAVHDVITGIDGEAVDSPAALTDQILGRKPGENVSLNLIHRGQPTDVSVALGERPAPNQVRAPHLRNGRMLDELMLDGMPREQARRLRGLIERNLGGPDDRPMQDVMEEMKRRMDEMMQNGVPQIDGNGGNLRFQSDATVRMMDENGSIELRSRDGGKEVTLRDRDGEITWTGPWDTEQDKAAAPEGVRERVENLNIDGGFAGGGLRFRMGLNPMPAPDED